MSQTGRAFWTPARDKPGAWVAERLVIADEAEVKLGEGRCLSSRLTKTPEGTWRVRSLSTEIVQTQQTAYTHLEAEAGYRF